MGIGSSVGKRLAPRIQHLAPETTSRMVREALQRAIAGAGPLPGAVAMAGKQLADEDGNVERAVREVIELHVRYAGGTGFVTNLGGIMTVALTIPANISGLAIIQCRMVAGIAHLRGYDLDDPRVRNAILVCIMGEDQVNKLVKKRKLPAPPMALATAPTHDPDMDQVITAQVAADLISRAAGTRLATSIGRRVPIVGGLVGLTSDAYSTWRIGRYADKELLPRARR